MSVVAQRVRNTVVMVPRCVCVALLYTFTTVLGSAGGQDSQDKRSRVVWYRARVSEYIIYHVFLPCVFNIVKLLFPFIPDFIISLVFRTAT